MAEETFRFSADRRFIRTVVRSQTTPRMRLWRSVGLVAGLGAIVAAVLGEATWIIVAIVVMLVAGIILMRTMAPVRQVAMAMQQQFARIPDPKEIGVTVGDDGLHLDNGQDTEDVPWEMITGVFRGDHVWWVHMTGGTSLPLPADQITGGAMALIDRYAPATSGHVEQGSA